MKEVLKRSVTGVCLIVIICLAIYSGVLWFFVLCSAICTLSLLEFYRLFGLTDNRLASFTAILLTTCLLVSFFLFSVLNFDTKIFLINVPVISLILASALYSRSNNPFYDIAIIFLGQIYITLAVMLFYFTSQDAAHTYHKGIALGYFLLLWSNDTAAYVCGNIFGKNALAPIVSPNKTWEGSLGGAFLVVTMTFINSFFFRELALIHWMVVGVIVIIMGTLGDLTKSVIKRSFNVKDSGKLLPGHGGALDRFDSLIGSAPVVFLYVRLAVN